VDGKGLAAVSEFVVCGIGGSVNLNWRVSSLEISGGFPVVVRRFGVIVAFDRFTEGEFIRRYRSAVILATRSLGACRSMVLNGFRDEMTEKVHPDHWSNGPRIGARAVVVDCGRILLLKYERDGEVLYLFPGGGHEPGETLAENARREVLEETGLDVEVGRILAVHEHQQSKGIEIPGDLRSIYVGDVHRIDFFFECSVIGEVEPNLEVEPDLLHTGFKWVLPGELADVRIIPEIAAEIVESLGHSGDPMFSES
jgi:8-oxo-dGTP pyrophosphatase MutT (NUDIX family)